MARLSDIICVILDRNTMFLQTDMHPENKKRQLWTRTHVAVLVPCPQCKAEPGELCRGTTGWRMTATHAMRRDVARKTTVVCEKHLRLRLSELKLEEEEQ